MFSFIPMFDDNSNHWSYENGSWNIIVSHAGVENINVTIENSLLHIVGENKMFGKEFSIDNTYNIPIPIRAISNVAYQTKNGVTRISVVVDEKERTIPINKI